MSPNIGGEKGPNTEINQPIGGESNSSRTVEATPSHPEVSSINQPPVQIPVLPQTSTPGVTDTNTVKASSDVPQKDDTGLIASDGDKIEKQWVERTKTVVAQTQDDPRRQKDEISKIKAEYIKKRFKKIIRVK